MGQGRVRQDRTGPRPARSFAERNPVINPGLEQDIRQFEDGLIRAAEQQAIQNRISFGSKKMKPPKLTMLSTSFSKKRGHHIRIKGII